MVLFGLTFLVALIACSLGFRKYIWFISIGYGFAIAAIGVFLLVASFQPNLETRLACALFLVYGLRLGGYLGIRELQSASYNAKMKGEVKSGAGMSIIAKCGIWVGAALLYACQTAPLTFRLTNGAYSDMTFVVGMIISVIGLILESIADLQKNAAKKRSPRRFVDKGLYRIVRCPNYFGEMLFWTGVFVGGIPSYTGVLQWVIALLGYAGIIFVMFSGARRLELRQNRTYGADPSYQEYVQKTPILIPLVPLYSVAKYKWLVA